MRIGIDCRTYGAAHGYIGLFTESLVLYLEQNKDSNTYILFFHDRELTEFSTKSPNIQTVKIAEKIGSLAGQVSFPRRLYRENLDAMLFSGPNIPFFYRRKSIILLSDLVSYFYPEKRLKGSWMRYWSTLLLRQSIQQARSIIALSGELKRDIIEIFDTPEDKIRVIPPMSQGVGSGTEREARQFLQKEGIAEKYILCIGELREYKNIPRLLQAYNLLLKEDAIDADLILVGKEDPAYHEIRSTLIGLGIQNRVHIYNVLEKDKIDLLYREATVYTLPSLYEGSEQVILSPIEHGLPIASAQLPSITEILGKGEVSYFRPMSINEMREALKKILSKPPERTKRDMSKYSPETVSEQILEVVCSTEKP